MHAPIDSCAMGPTRRSPLGAAGAADRHEVEREAEQRSRTDSSGDVEPQTRAHEHRPSERCGLRAKKVLGRRPSRSAATKAWEEAAPLPNRDDKWNAEAKRGSDCKFHGVSSNFHGQNYHKPHEIYGDRTRNAQTKCESDDA